MTDDDAEAALAEAAQRRLIEMRAAHAQRVRAEDERRRDEGAARLRALLRDPGPAAAAARALGVDRSSALAVVSNEVMAARGFAAALSAGIAEMRERAEARGIEPAGDAFAGMLAWEPDAQTRGFDAAIAAGKRFIVVCGDLGVGKTSLAARAVFLWRRGDGRPSPILVAAAEALEALARPYDDKRRALVAHMRDCLCLGIDDLFRHHATDAELEALRDLCAARTEEGRATVITTNATPDDVATRLVDARLRDRVKGRSTLVHLQGPSRRGGRR